MNIKLKLRDTVAKGLLFMPIGAFERLRRGQFTAGPASLICRQLIRNVVRHRRVGTEIRSFSLVDAPELKLLNDGSFISRQLYWSGRQGYEYGEAKLWAFLCGRDEFSRIVEMGANIGYFTIIGGSASKSDYIAIEANPFTAAHLAANVELNALSNVEVVASAIVGYKTSDSMELFIPQEETDESSPTGAYLGGGESINRPSNRSVKVKVVEAKGLVANADLIKLDIEGYEFAVLDSVLPEIREKRPLIWVEVRRNTHELRGLLSSLAREEDYLIYAIGEKSLSGIDANQIRSVVLQESFGTRDVLVIPAEKKSIVGSYRPV